MVPLRALGLPPSGLFSFSVSGIVNAVLAGVVSWVARGARSLTGLFGHALVATSAVRFGAGFLIEFDLLRSFGAELVGAFLVAVVLQALAARDLGLLGRAVGFGLPVALLGSTVALEGVAVLVRATDGLSAALISAAGRPVGTFLAALGAVLVGTAASAPLASGFAALVLGLVLGLVVLCCWLELVIRAGAITVAVLFLPLALAGAVWPATRHWSRRLAETIFALVLAKVVIAAVFALALFSLGGANGPGALVEGIALFLLCAWAPFALLRLVPFVEAGAVAHLEVLGQRGARVAAQVEPLVSDRLAPGPPPGVEEREGVGWLMGDPSVRIAVDPDDLGHFGFLGAFAVARDPAERAGTDRPYPSAPPTVVRVEDEGGEPRA